jgi:chromosome segregation ATPase
MSKADAHFIWLKQHADQSKTIEAMQDQLDRAHKAAEKNLTEELAGLQRRLEDAKNAETTALNGIIKDLKAKKSQAEKEVKPLQTEITKLRRAAVAMQKKLTKAET